MNLVPKTKKVIFYFILSVCSISVQLKLLIVSCIKQTEIVQLFQCKKLKYCESLLLYYCILFSTPVL